MLRRGEEERKEEVERKKRKKEKKSHVDGVDRSFDPALPLEQQQSNPAA